MNISSTDLMVAILPASVVVLGAAATIYFFAYRLYSQKFFMCMTYVWIANAAYILCEVVFRKIINLPEGPDKIVPFIPGYLASVPTTFVLYAAYHFLDYDRKRLDNRIFVKMLLWSLIIVGFVILGLRLQMLSDSTRFVIMSAPGISFATFVLLTLAWKIGKMKNQELLQILRGTDTREFEVIDNRFGAARTPVLDAIVPRHLSRSRVALYLSFLFYGIIQFMYFYKFRHGAEYWFVGVFYFALLLKIVNALGIGVLLFADFRRLTEIVRLRSMAAELGAMTATIEHDIKNPISNLQKKLSVLKERNQSNGELQGDLRFISAQVSRILAAADIIPTVRETEAYYRARFAKLNLGDLAGETASLVRKAWQDVEFRIVVEPYSKPIIVLGYKLRLQQALVNLLNNALEASFEAKRESIPSVRIQCHADKESEIATLEIIDRGVGIKPEIIELVTIPMFSTKTEKPNRGLGLYLAKKVIEQHGGTLAIESDGSSYTKVRVTLPLAEQKERSERNAKEDEV